jgi:hypothetical protein
MGLLDDLEKEAERQRASHALAADERELRDQRWNEQILPAMRALDNYLQRLTRNLAFLKKRSRTLYALPGYGDVVAYIEPSYVQQSTPAATTYEIILEGLATVASEECPLLVCENPTRVRSVAAALKPHRLTGISEARKNANGEILSAQFQAKGRIALKLSIQADCESGQVRMSFQNFEQLGTTARTFQGGDLDEKLFDALGRFITREDQRFGQEEVPDDIRRQLQSRIQRDQIRRQWETKLSRQLHEDEARVIASLDPSLRPGGLMGRLRLLSR